MCECKKILLSLRLKIENLQYGKSNGKGRLVI